MQYSVYTPEQHAIYKSHPGCLDMVFSVTIFNTEKIKSVSLYQKTMFVTRESWRIMSQMEDEKVHEGSGMYLPAVDPWGCKARLDLHQHLRLDSSWQALDRFTPGLIYRLQPLHGLSWCCHCVCRCTEAAISPISLIMAGKCQLVFYPIVNKDKYHRAAQPSQLPPTQYFWWAIRCPGHVLLRFNRLIWINSHLSGSGGRGSINISAPLWLFP